MHLTSLRRALAATAVVALGALVTAPAASAASTETTAEPVVGPYRYNFSAATPTP